MSAETMTIATLTAADVMTARPRTCSLFSSVLEAVMIFRAADCGAVPVVDDGVPVGIVTDREVALATTDDTELLTRPVTDIMTWGVIAAAPGATLEEVRARFDEHGTDRLLVVDAAGQLQGIIARSDLAPRVAERAGGRLDPEAAGS